MGKVLVDDYAILIYERAQVEAGGVEYIVRHDQMLTSWLSDAVRYVRDCRYECSEGCVKCLYIQDPLCHPILPREMPNTYLIPNELLSRKLLVDFWGLKDIAPVTEEQGTRPDNDTAKGYDAEEDE